VTVAFKDADGKLPIMCIGITSGVGRLIFGYIADLPKVNRILLQQVNMLASIFNFILQQIKNF
jgi:MCP family monocarboxylic acid transporter-like MFS transporter 10